MCKIPLPVLSVMCKNSHECLSPDVSDAGLEQPAVLGHVGHHGHRLRAGQPEYRKIRFPLTNSHYIKFLRLKPEKDAARKTDFLFGYQCGGAGGSKKHTFIHFQIKEIKY